MTESVFNTEATPSYEGDREIPLSFRSERYLYFKSRQKGLLTFIKRPAPEFVADMRTIEALRKEFLLCFPLSHPSLVRYIAFENNSLIEEFIDGETLRSMIDRDDKRLYDPRFTLSIVSQLFDVLDYIHRQGILHLDIKPENLMITRIGNNLKLIDFSCAQSSTNEISGGYTPEYKAPEQGQGTPDCTTDIYLAGNVSKLLAEKAGLSNRWKIFLNKATTKEAGRRYNSAREALENLPSSIAKNHLPLYVTIISAILIVGLIIAIPLTNRSEISSKNEESETSDQLSPNELISETPGIALGEPKSQGERLQSIDKTTDNVSTKNSKGDAPEKEDEIIPNSLFPDHIYLIGNVEGGRMDPSKGVMLRGNNGIYSGVYEFTKSSGDDYSYFCFTESIGNSWDETGSRWAPDHKSYGDKDYEINNEKNSKYNLGQEDNISFKVIPGKYYVKFDLNTMSMSFRPV